MRRLLPLLSLFTLAIWLTATEHCALEQANLINTTCANHCAADQTAHNDGCNSVEDGTYRLSNNAPKVLAPSLVLFVCLLCLYRAALREPAEQSYSIGDLGRRARNWIANWHFVRRGAPLPGAPSLLLA